MTEIIDDENKCNFCGADWQTNGYCANGHPNLLKGTKSLNPIKIIEKMKEGIEVGKTFNADVSLNVAEAEIILLCVEQLFPDNCEICKGQRGGVRGNENIVDGKRMCDYCSVDHDKKE
ncbi:hypothetical protein LCGC14_1315960 [marine sediment metagenome]|uniref:Uncharacterized protein n=1 Tax=marine sediment metagenome TaxID=412755 RepID=A0A0F9KLI9_9ZZZZ